MMEYTELVKKLRNRRVCLQTGLNLDNDYPLLRDAADAVEELQQTAEHYKGCADDWYKEACDYKALAPKWIPVTERLPEDNKAVNVVWVNHNPVFYYQHIKDKPQTSTGVYYRGQWYWWSAVAQDYLAEYGKWEPDLMDSAIEVTHWMPLPEPPQESNQ